MVCHTQRTFHVGISRRVQIVLCFQARSGEIGACVIFDDSFKKKRAFQKKKDGRSNYFRCLMRWHRGVSHNVEGRSEMMAEL